MDKGPDPADYDLKEKTITVPEGSFPRPVQEGERPGQQTLSPRSWRRGGTESGDRKASRTRQGVTVASLPLSPPGPSFHPQARALSLSQASRGNISGTASMRLQVTVVGQDLGCWPSWEGPGLRAQNSAEGVRGQHGAPWGWRHLSPSGRVLGLKHLEMHGAQAEGLGGLLS